MLESVSDTGLVYIGIVQDATWFTGPYGEHNVDHTIIRDEHDYLGGQRAHFEDHVDRFLGKRVRVTVEVLEDEETPA